MRTLNKNKQTMYYALLDKEVPVYDVDENGDIIYIEIDGVIVPVETGDTRIVYSEPVPFKGNISMSGGESQEAEFGINTSDYSAVLVVDKELLPITETSRIWYESEPQHGQDGYVDEYSADYTVVKPAPSLNGERFVLKKVVK